MIDRIPGLERPVNGRQKLLPDYTTSPPPGPSPSTARPVLELPPAAELSKTIERFIGDHPVLAITIGVTLGVVLGCLIKRR